MLIKDNCNYLRYGERIIHLHYVLLNITILESQLIWVLNPCSHNALEEAAIYFLPYYVLCSLVSHVEIRIFYNFSKYMQLKLDILVIIWIIICFIIAGYCVSYIRLVILKIA